MVYTDPRTLPSMREDPLGAYVDAFVQQPETECATPAWYPRRSHRYSASTGDGTPHTAAAAATSMRTPSRGRSSDTQSHVATATRTAPAGIAPRYRSAP
jgi:hypothetical protein